MYVNSEWASRLGTNQEMPVAPHSGNRGGYVGKRWKSKDFHVWLQVFLYSLKLWLVWLKKGRKEIYLINSYPKKYRKRAIAY